MVMIARRRLPRGIATHSYHFIEPYLRAIVRFRRKRRDRIRERAAGRCSNYRAASARALSAAADTARRIAEVGAPSQRAKQGPGEVVSQVILPEAEAAIPILVEAGSSWSSKAPNPIGFMTLVSLAELSAGR